MYTNQSVKSSQAVVNAIALLTQSSLRYVDTNEKKIPNVLGHLSLVQLQTIQMFVCFVCFGFFKRKAVKTSVIQTSFANKPSRFLLLFGEFDKCNDVFQLLK